MKTYIGIDWSEKHHNVNICNEWGASLAQFEIPHEVDGFAYLVKQVQFEAFFIQHRYPRRRRLPEIYAQLHRQSLPLSPPDLAQIHQEQTAYLAQLLAHLTQQKKATIQQVNRLFQQHPDHVIFASLPGAGDLLAPKLLAIFGDN